MGTRILAPGRIAQMSMSLPLISMWQARRRLLGWLRRKTRWEFWPPWIAYFPLLPYLLYLGLKYRSVTLFTAANPGIPSGGFVGESKSRILGNLGAVPAFALIPCSLSADARFAAAQKFLCQHELNYPVVLKPNVGERGRGVVIARNDGEVRSYLKVAITDVMIQKFVPGLEFGIFYYRYPDEAKGQIFSITQKQFPAISGDGKSTILDLILQDDRAVCLADLYLAQMTRHGHEVPAVSEAIPLTQVGSHCRGAVFLNGAHLESNALRSAVERAANFHPGFFFGRFDVRASSVHELQAGRFQILELNGVASEATHVYDPSVSLREAYRVMFRQWKIAFEIGAANRKAGTRPMRLIDFLQLVRSRRGDCGASADLSASRNLLVREYFPDQTGY